MTATGEVTLNVDAGIAWIRLCRADKLNALAGDMREQLTDAIGRAAREPAVSGLVVTGSGRAFCAGGDVEVMADLHERGDEAGFRKILHAGAECVLALQAFPGLTIAALNGVAAGAGVGLALACDLRVAVPESRLIASWSRIGLAPDWGASYFLTRLLGRPRALRLILDAQPLTAERSLELGLVDEVVPVDDLLQRAAQIITERGAARDMVRAVKSLVARAEQGSLEATLAAETEIQETLFSGGDVREGLEAFRARRPPRFGQDQ